jgi:hypothetical protein
MERWLKQEHVKQSQTMKTNSSTQQFLKEAGSFTPFLLNVSSSSETHGTHKDCIQNVYK